MNNIEQLKLLHVASSHLMGLTNQEIQLALAYKSLGNVHIILVSGENEQIAGSFDTLKAAKIPFFTIMGFDEHRNLLRLVKEFMSVAKKTKPDIVSVNTNWQITIAALARLFGWQSYKIVYTVHGFRHNHPTKSIIARVLIAALLFLFADAINAPTSYVRNKFALLKYKIKSIPLGEDDLFFENSKLPNFYKPLSFCFPGQFRKGKNQAMLIEAFAKYVKQTDDKQARLVLPGEGDFLSDCKAIANKLDISGQIVFPGQLDRREMLEAYTHCQVAIIPTNSETFGHCIAEPLVMKRVVLSRPVGIAPDLISHGINGFLFGGERELVDLMATIGSMKKDDLIRIAEAAGMLGQHFRWDYVAKQYIEKMMLPLLGHSKV